MPSRLTDLLLACVLAVAICGAVDPAGTADWLRQTWHGIVR